MRFLCIPSMVEEPVFVQWTFLGYKIFRFKHSYAWYVIGCVTACVLLYKIRFLNAIRRQCWGKAANGETRSLLSNTLVHHSTCMQTIAIILVYICAIVANGDGIIILYKSFHRYHETRRQWRTFHRVFTHCDVEVCRRCPSFAPYRTI